ncbi:MAG: hypothetical protein ACLFSD_00085 [Salinivenus sp.]
MDTVADVVDRAEDYAAEYFDVDDPERETFTSVTMWDDGDFTVKVRHGMGYEEVPYSQDVELVTYSHQPDRTWYT